jgi:opacity protein-like surface antigen
MFIFARSSALASVLLALCLGAGSAHAQAMAVPYANSNSLLGLGSPGLDGGDVGARNNMPSGWFVANTQGSLGGFNRLGAFSNFSSLSAEGVQFGYNMKNTPLSIYAGFDTLKYNPPGSTAFSAFDSKAGTAPGAFSANAGIEYRPTSNLSLSLGASFSQYNSGPVDSDINSQLLPGQTPFSIGGVRR